MFRYIPALLILLVSCQGRPQENAVGILWNEQPGKASSSMMVVSGLKGRNLRLELKNDLNNLGFVIEKSNESQLITEPRPVEDHVMRLIIQINEEAIVMTGEKSIEPNQIDNYDWKTIQRGEGNYASPEWELMKVLATSIDHVEILYN